MRETPERAARRIVTGVLRDWATDHPDPDTRWWAQRACMDRLAEDQEATAAVFRRMGQAYREAFEQIRSFAAAVADGIATHPDQEDSTCPTP